MRGVSYERSCGGEFCQCPAVGTGKPACAEFDASEVACDDGEYVGKFFHLQYPEHRMSCRSLRFSVVSRFFINPFCSRPHGPAVMGRVFIGFADSCQCFFRFFSRMYRNELCYKQGFFDFFFKCMRFVNGNIGNKHGFLLFCIVPCFPVCLPGISAGNRKDSAGKGRVLF